MKLYEFGPSRAIRVRWTLQELGVDFDTVTVNLMAGEHLRPEFLEINPAGKLPALVDGNLVLTESVAIVLYLAEKYSERGLIPEDLGQRAEFYRWLLFTTTELEQPLWRITRHTSIYPADKRLPADIALARGDFEGMGRVLEEHMDGREFLAGTSATVADFVLAYTLDWAAMLHLLDGLPRLHRYMQRMYARPKAPPRIKDIVARIRGG